MIAVLLAALRDFLKVGEHNGRASEGTSPAGATGRLWTLAFLLFAVPAHAASLSWTWPAYQEGTTYPCHLDSALVAVFTCCDSGSRTVVFALNPAGKEGARDTLQLPESNRLEWWQITTHNAAGWSNWSNQAVRDARPFETDSLGFRRYCPIPCDEPVGLWQRIKRWFR